MPLTSIGTRKKKSQPAVTLLLDGARLEIGPWKGHKLNAGAVMASLRHQAQEAGTDLPPRTMVHENADGSFSIGLGIPVPVGQFEWPDEEKTRIRLERQGYL